MEMMLVPGNTGQHGVADSRNGLSLHGNVKRASAQTFDFNTYSARVVWWGSGGRTAASLRVAQFCSHSHSLITARSKREQVHCRVPYGEYWCDESDDQKSTCHFIGGRMFFLQRGSTSRIFHFRSAVFRLVCMICMNPPPSAVHQNTICINNQRQQTNKRNTDR